MTVHTVPPVVVGIDGSPASLDALRWAARTAERHRAPMHLVYGIGAPIDYGPGISVIAFDNQAFRDDGETLLASAAKVARAAVNRPDELDIATSVTDPAPTPVLLERSHQARLVVVGTRGLGAIGRGILGSVSTSLARHAHCPVVVVPEIEPGSPDRTQSPVVVGVDGSACSTRAIDIAFDEASARGVGLIAVTAWSEFFRYESRNEMQEQASALQSESLAGYTERYPDVQITHVVAEDRPARRILREAENAQLIVVGSHGRGGFAGMTLGSVSQAVLHSTHIPVIIARPQV